MMTTFIDRHRAEYGVEALCKQLPIAASTYYEQKARQADPERSPVRAKRDLQFQPQVRRVWDENQQVYGVRKVWKQLNRERIPVAKCTVDRLMKRLGIEGVRRGAK